MASDRQFFHALTVAVVRYARHHGMTDREIGLTLKTDLSRLDSSRFQLDPQRLLDLTRTISARSGKPFSGLHLTQFMKMGDFGIAAYVLMNCRNMMQVQEKYQTYYRLMGNVTRLSIRLGRRQTSFSWKPVLELPADIERMVMEYLVTTIVAYSFELTGFRLPITAVEFNGPEPENISEFIQLLGPNISFEREQTALHFDSSYMKLPVITSNSELLSVFEDHARQRYDNLIRTASFSEKVGRLLRENLPVTPKLATIANELDLSPRSLQTYLRDEGTTFLKIRDEIRYQYARKALARDDCSAAEIGLQLGFSEPSAFFRTFKRWCGKSPGQYRKEIETQKNAAAPDV